MTLQQRLSALITAMGADVKTLFSRTVPTGGSSGQVLTKTSATDYALEWSTPAAGGGAGLMPTYVGPGESYTIPANSQGLSAYPILVEGSLIIDGTFIEV